MVGAWLGGSSWSVSRSTWPVRWLSRGRSTREPAAETREEALTRIGANFWIVLFREGERAHVRAGLGLLGFGFVLQLSGYLTQFDAAPAAIAVCVASAAAAGGVLIAVSTAQRAVPLSYRETLDLPQGIGDERHAHHLADFEEVRRWRALYASKMISRPIERKAQHAPTRVNWGRWVFDCPACGGSGTATPQIATVICFDPCAAEYVADFPQDRDEIERLLMLRPDERNRNWAGESVEQLARENQHHGVHR